MGAVVEDTEREHGKVKATRSPFDETKLTAAQREALAIARAQGRKPVASLWELKLNIEADELEQFANTLDELRDEARTEKAKDRLE